MAAKDASEDAPTHIAIIMDGNGRWATGRGKPRLFGHRAGANRVREIVEAAPDCGIRYLTLFAFSTENWKRSRAEVAGLMAMFRLYIKREAAELNASGVRVRFVGDRRPLNPGLLGLMERLEQDTERNTRLHLTIALNYGSRDELTQAAVALAVDIAQGRVQANDVTPESLARHLYTDGLPDPDLVIRTSGETRISNFLLWQSAYAEYEFTDVLWPDFSRAHLQEIVLSFAGRERRFGSVLT
ncbi:polyprenyl diphosphate synthase [Pseudoruegeria sp. SK021]|uniref:polyprenyl diphosphate synthase n=1 Tax=Pseudoruegeria sp. SK021 TaxID=1933035 RepID=UPI000A21ABBB|nr:polyprenyl diphosphate synthase [Pseudoruegeria sp. SK021]OSP53642.1 di-trans,poly-cis-decaprenylcistransferase [Pseudoruegeria sp. SK021]